jgi:3-carboxy-cis,cis-muconate cycloisomerase
MPSHVIDSDFLRDLYGTPAMRAVWSDHQLLQKWLDYEAALARAEAQVGLIPPEAAAEITRKARAELFDFHSIKSGIDQAVHPLVPVIWQLSSICEPPAGGYVHWGATTQDVMDTALILQIRDAMVLIDAGLADVTRTLCGLAVAYRDTAMPGRTHGQQALPMTFGFKVAGWLAECVRHADRLKNCRPRLLVGQFGGAAGTLAGIAQHGFDVKMRLMAELGLNDPLIAWHASRDNIVEFCAVTSSMAATMGRIAHDIIHLQMLEFGEAEESWQAGKVGSSTMPQKRNPMLCEAILTTARLARPHTGLSLDAMMHDFERDWSSVQMEWEFVPELCILAHGGLTMMQRVLMTLAVHPERMRANLDISGGQVLAERVMFALADRLGRQRSHDIVHEVSMEAIESNTSFAAALKAHPEIAMHLKPSEIDVLLDPSTYVGLCADFVDRVVASATAGVVA